MNDELEEAYEMAKEEIKELQEEIENLKEIINEIRERAYYIYKDFERKY